MDNRPGANGTLAVNTLRGQSNAYSAILLGGVSRFFFNPNLYSNLPYDRVPSRGVGAMTSAG